MLPDTEASSTDETLETLKPVFPELLVTDQSDLRLPVDIRSITPVEFLLMGEYTGKVQDSFRSEDVGAYEVRFGLLSKEDNFDISSEVLAVDVMRSMAAEVKSLIREAVADGFEEMLVLSVCNFLAIEVPSGREALLLNDYCFRTDDASVYKKWKENCAAARIRRFSRQLFQCPICLERVTGLGAVLLGCEHVICKGCIKDYATATINYGDVTKLQCPDCPIEVIKNANYLAPDQLKRALFKVKIPSDTLREVISERMVKKYEDMLHNKLFERFSYQCPRLCAFCERCKKWSFKADADELLVVCTHCRFAFCHECRHSWHGYKNECRTAMGAVPENVIRDMLDEKFPEEKKNAYRIRYGRVTMKRAIDREVDERNFRDLVENDSTLVPCPSCSCITQRVDGCNRMLCTHCWQYFCNLCGVALPEYDPYGHFSIRTSTCYRRLFQGTYI